MTDRELMQMALDALEQPSPIGGFDNQAYVAKALRDRLAQPEWVGLTDEEFEEYAHWIYPEKLIELENLLKEKNT
jgi:hypothetical protein